MSWFGVSFIAFGVMLLIFVVTSVAVILVSANKDDIGIESPDDRREKTGHP